MGHATVPNGDGGDVCPGKGKVVAKDQRIVARGLHPRVQPQAIGGDIAVGFVSVVRRDIS